MARYEVSISFMVIDEKKNMNKSFYLVIVYSGLF